MKRKVVAFALATIVGATVLAGCTGNSASKSQGGTFTPGKSVGTVHLALEEDLIFFHGRFLTS